MNNFKTFGESNEEHNRQRTKHFPHQQKQNSNQSTISDHQSNSRIVDDFWDDCITPLRVSVNSSMQTSPPRNQQNQNRNKSSTKKRNNSQKQLNSKLLNKLYAKCPDIYESILKNKKINKKRKIAEKRCIQMFTQAKENQLMHQNKIVENKLKKINDEMLKCTWKPEINKRTKKQAESLKNCSIDCIFQINKSKNFINKHNQLLANKTKEEEEKIEQEKINENTILFKPKLNSNLDLAKVFNDKSCLENRGSFEFLSRYEKARKEYNYKRNKILSPKDLPEQQSVQGNITDMKMIGNNTSSISINGCKMRLHKQLNEIALNEEPKELLDF